MGRRRALFRPGLYLAPLALGVAASGCSDSVGGDGRMVAQLALRPEFPSAVVPGLFDLDVDRVRVRLTRPPAESVIDTLVFFPVNEAQLNVRLQVPLLSRREQLVASLELSAGSRLLFAGTREVEVTEESSIAPSVPLQYVGPGTEMTSIRIEPRDSALRPGEVFRFNVHALAGQAPIESFYVGWSSSDPAVAPVDAKGTLRAPAGRGDVLLRVVSPTGIKDSTRVWFSPPPVTTEAAGGDGQSGQAGTQLPSLLEVRVLAADGQGVPGVRVRFTSLAGGAIRDTNTITDGLGIARTAAILGPIAGLQLFEATAPFLPPVTFRTTALAGPPARVAVLSGNNQFGMVGQLLANPMVARVTDGLGNAIPGVPITWSVVAGNGTLEEVNPSTDLAGLAFATYRLGTSPGSNVVRAQAAPFLFTDFGATATVGPAAAVSLAAGEAQSDTVRAQLAPFTVRVTDEFGNPVSGVQVRWSQVEGGGTLDPAVSPSDVTGRARSTYTLPAVPGVFHVIATVNGLPDTVTFTATAAPASPSLILVSAGDAQEDAPGTELAPFVVQVTDQFGNAVAGVTVTWEVEDGDGTLSAATSVTSAAGLASVIYTLGPDPGSHSIRGQLAGGASAVFTATATTP